MSRIDVSREVVYVELVSSEVNSGTRHGFLSVLKNYLRLFCSSRMFILCTKIIAVKQFKRSHASRREKGGVYALWKLDCYLVCRYVEVNLLNGRGWTKLSRHRLRATFSFLPMFACIVSRRGVRLRRTLAFI